MPVGKVWRGSVGGDKVGFCRWGGDDDIVYGVNHGHRMEGLFGLFYGGRTVLRSVG